MREIKVSLDSQGFHSKPTNQVAAISKRIAREKKVLNSLSAMTKFATDVGCNGHTFCPATFKNEERKKENFEQQQLFVLDFDNQEPKNTVSIDEVKARAAKYELPIFFTYDTFSSINHNKFRVVFMNDIPIQDRIVAEAMQLALGTIFPEADASCYKDVSKMYFGSNSMENYYIDENIAEINIESLFRNLCYYFENRYKKNHYKERIAKFSKQTSVVYH